MTDTANVNGLPQIAMSNTKKEMIEAYGAMKKLLEARERELVSVEKAKKQFEKKAALAAAEVQAAQDPILRIHDLRSSVSKELAALAEKFDEELETYRKVQAAVQAKQEDLKNMYDIETEASDLAALIQAQQMKKEEFETEMSLWKSEFEQEMTEARETWDTEKAARDAQFKEKNEQRKKERDREEEAYEYDLNREREQQRNALEDELRGLQKEITDKKETFERETASRGAELKRKEIEAVQKEEAFDELTKRVEQFPSESDAEVKAAVKDATLRITADFDKNEALLKATFEGEKNVLLSKIESLEKLAQSQAEQISELSRKNEQAYEKVQEIANIAVSSAHREIISVPYGAPQTTSDNKA